MRPGHPVSRRGLVAALMATTMCSSASEAANRLRLLWIPRVTPNLLVAASRNIGANTKATHSGVPLTTTMLAPGATIPILDHYTVTQTSGPSGYFQTAVSGGSVLATGVPATVAASGITPVPTTSGANNVLGSLSGTTSFTFTVIAYDASSNVLGTATLTYNLVTSFVRPAYTLQQGRISAASSGNAAMGAYTFTKVATVSSSAEFNAYNNAASGDCAFLASLNGSAYQALFYSKQPGTGASDTKRCIITSEFGASNPTTLLGVYYNGSASAPTYRCEDINLIFQPTPISSPVQNCIGFAFANDCHSFNAFGIGNSFQGTAAFLTTAGRWLNNQTQPHGVSFGLNNGNSTNCSVQGADFVSVIGNQWLGPWNNCVLENCTQQLSGVDQLSFDGQGPNNTLGPAQVVNCLFGRPGWGYAHPDFGQIQTGTTAWGYETTYGALSFINYRQHQFDGRGTAHGGPFQGTPILTGIAKFSSLFVGGGHVYNGLESHGLDITDQPNIKLYGFGLYRAMQGVTGGLNSPGGTANTSPYTIAGGGAHDGYGTAQYEITHNQDVFPSMPYVSGTEQLYGPLNFNPGYVRGGYQTPTVGQNPSVAAGDSFTLSSPGAVTFTVTFTAVAASSTSAASIAAQIVAAASAAGNTSVLASTFANGLKAPNTATMLQLSDNNANPITLVDTVPGTLAKLGLTAGTFGAGWGGVVRCGISQGGHYFGYPNTPAGLTLDYYNRGKASSATPPNYGNVASQDDMSGFLSAPNNNTINWASYFSGLTLKGVALDGNTFTVTSPKASWRAALQAAEAAWIAMYTPLGAAASTGPVTLDRGDGTWNSPLTGAGKWNQYGLATLALNLPGSASGGATVNGTVNLVAIGGSPDWDPYNTGILGQDVVCAIKVNGTTVQTVTISAGTTSAAVAFTMPGTGNAAIATANDSGLLDQSATVTGTGSGGPNPQFFFPDGTNLIHVPLAA
jgi:hypothetical protein